MGLALYRSRVRSSEVLGDIALVGTSINLQWSKLIPHRCDLLQIVWKENGNRTSDFILKYVSTLVRDKPVRAVARDYVDAVAEGESRDVGTQQACLKRSKTKLRVIGQRHRLHLKNSDALWARDTD